MSKFYPAIDAQFQEFIEEQKLFFTASAPASGRVNVSPKGMDTFRVIGPNTVAYLDLTGSGNETAAHIGENGRLTIMFCSFGRQPMIMRLFTMARIVQRDEPEWANLIVRFPDISGTRQIIVGNVAQVQTACGFGVPEYEFKRVRPTLEQWSDTKGEEGILEYWADNNQQSIDGLPTHLRV